ncbi:phasin family protein [Rhodovulum marinum]|nr:phasin family protein [Rhodovulum marinum]
MLAYSAPRCDSLPEPPEMPTEPQDAPAASPLDAVLRAQAEGFGLMAWVGAAMLDHAARTASEMAAFARDEARRDVEALGRLARARNPEQLADLPASYLGAKIAACTDEAGRLARMTAETCEVTRRRMAGER